MSALVAAPSCTSAGPVASAVAATQARIGAILSGVQSASEVLYAGGALENLQEFLLRERYTARIT